MTPQEHHKSFFDKKNVITKKPLDNEGHYNFFTPIIKKSRNLTFLLVIY